VSDGQSLDHLRAELLRLKTLVGADENSYAQLRSNYDAAERYARDAAASRGELEGLVAELQAEMAMLRAELSAARRQPAESDRPLLSIRFRRRAADR
jgi:septal ring factor EnvC (AmiA/AmiB activator)